MTDQDRFDNFIRRAARDAEPVPETPREDMWAAITAARAESRTAALAESAAPMQAADVIPIAPRQQKAEQKRTAVWMGWSGAAAAILIIGVGIGRLSLVGPRSASNATPGPQPTLADATSSDRSHDSAAMHRPSATAATATTDRALENLSKPAIVAVAPEHTPGFARAVKSTTSRMSNSAVVRDRTDKGAYTAASENAVVVSYRFAASKHFTRVQTLLVTLPGDARDGHINEIAVRAADLLVNTRLLLDSPAARDAETKRLLEDLELILAQVATISPTHSAEDVQLIQDAITKHDVLLRLRAITAGQHLSGT